MQPDDLRASASAAGLAKALTLFPDQLERAAQLVRDQRQLLGSVDDPALGLPSPPRT